MGFILSISSDTIDSKRQRPLDLFKWQTAAVEIGHLGYNGDFELLMNAAKQSGVRVGLHCPLYILDSRYGLLYDDGEALDELHRTCALAQEWGAEYVICHFPYIWDESGNYLPLHSIRRGLQALKECERTYNVPVVCEPKLGPAKDPSAFVVLMTICEMHRATWRDLSLCLDVGDIYLACKRLKYPYIDMISLFAPRCKVVHLHHVWQGGRKYYWAPIAKQGNVPLLETMKVLPTEPDIFAVLQHTPHRTGIRDNVGAQIDWLLENSGPWTGRRKPPRKSAIGNLTFSERRPSVQ